MRKENNVQIPDKTRGSRDSRHSTCNMHLRQYEAWGEVSNVEQGEVKMSFPEEKGVVR